MFSKIHYSLGRIFGKVHYGDSLLRELDEV